MWVVREGRAVRALHLDSLLGTYTHSVRFVKAVGAVGALTRVSGQIHLVAWNSVISGYSHKTNFDPKPEETELNITSSSQDRGLCLYDCEAYLGLSLNSAPEL